MTLVLGCLTHQYVVQVSDRRITRLRDGALMDDDRNKGTLVDGQFAFSYSGLAEVEGLHTDEWFARTVAEAQGRGGVWPEVVRDRATQALGNLKIEQKWKWHTFVGVGWIPSQETMSEVVPACMTISNVIEY